MFIKHLALFISFVPLALPTITHTRPARAEAITATVLGAIFGGGTAFYIAHYIVDTYMNDQAKLLSKEDE